MQKLVISTQYRENYAAHNEDYNHGVDQPHWKFKGGTTYVVPNFKDFNNVQDVVAKLTDLITYSNPGSEEYILDFEIVEQSAKVCESWETPIQVSQDGDKFVALKVIDNREDGWMKSEILEKTEAWTMMPEGERKGYSDSFLMEDGDIVEGPAGLKEWFNAKEAA